MTRLAGERPLFKTIVTMILAFVGTAALSQTNIVFATSDPSAPVTVIADELTYAPDLGEIWISGNIRVTQGKIVLTAETATIKTISPDTSEIGYIRLDGSVGLTNEESSASSSSGEYRVQDGIIELDGNVFLSRGVIEMSGASLLYDLEIGRSTLTGSASSPASNER